jgi:4-amino-4-deoxy-L-arabinose transferase-like glycosyltransferase
MADTVNYRSRLIRLVIFSTVLRLLLASLFELGNDEVYYWTYAQHLQWNYFDHPPLVALWIRVFTGNLELQYNNVFVRLGSIVSCAVCTVLLYHTVRRLHSAKAAWYAAVLYNLSIYAGIIAGLFILPDSPQLVFWCAALYCAIRIQENPSRWKFWMLFGICAGLSVMGKVHGVFLWFGMGLWILFSHRKLLRKPQLYVSAILSIAIASPILLWNLKNDFITWRFHSERVAVRGGINPLGFLREVGGQFFYNNPLIVVLTVLALTAFWKKRFQPPPAESLFRWIALPMIFVMLGIAVFRDTLPHWSGPAWITLLPFAAIFLAESPLRRVHVFLRGAAAFVFILLVAATALTYGYPGTLGSEANADYGFGDFTLDLHGWREAGDSFALRYRAEAEAGNMPFGAPLVSHKWFPAAHEDYYFAAPNNIPLLGLGNLHDLHHYAWLNRWRLHDIDPTKAWCMVPSNESFDVAKQFAPWYTQAVQVARFEQSRNGKPARYFTLWRLSGWKKKAEIPVQRN